MSLKLAAKWHPIQVAGVVWAGEVGQGISTRSSGGIFPLSSKPSFESRFEP